MRDSTRVTQDLARPMNDDWCEFGAYSDAVSAEVVAGLLRAELVAALVKQNEPLPGTLGGFQVMIPPGQLHRARWIMSQAEFTDEELAFAATGKLTSDALHRLARPSDLDAVYAIYMHPDVVPYLGFDPMPKREFFAIFEGLLACKGFFVAECDGVIKGFYRVTRNEGRSRHGAYLSTLAVSPDERGSGFAHEMMSDAIELLKQQGVLRVELMVEADNARALAFYRKLGFEQEGVIRAAYKRAGEDTYVDELYLGKLLAPLPRKNSEPN